MTTLHVGLSIMQAMFVWNGLASFTTLCLIFWMRHKGHLKFNLFTRCVVQMTFYQLMYDICDPLFKSAATGGSGYVGSLTSLHVFIYGGANLGGIGSSVWSFMILVGAVFTVHSGRQPTNREQLSTSILINLLVVANMIPAARYSYIAYVNPSRKDEFFVFRTVYDYIRITFIALSMALCVQLYYDLIKRSARGERQRCPLYHLLRKIVPYPLILIIARFGATVYKQVYHEGQDKLPLDAGSMQLFWFWIYIFFVAFVGFPCLVQFVRVTPGAGRSLIQMLHMDCIFKLPEAPAAWVENEIGGDAGAHTDNHLDLHTQSQVQVQVQVQAHRPPFPSRLRTILSQKKDPTLTAEEQNDILLAMNEEELAIAINFTYETRNRSNTSGLSYYEGEGIELPPTPSPPPFILTPPPVRFLK